jgi:hypothetical protein
MFNLIKGLYLAISVVSFVGLYNGEKSILGPP